MCPCATWWGVRRFVGESNGQSLLRSEATGERCHPPHHDTIGGTPPRGLGVSAVQEPEGPANDKRELNPSPPPQSQPRSTTQGVRVAVTKFSHKTYGILGKRDNAKVAVKSPPNQSHATLPSSSNPATPPRPRPGGLGGAHLHSPGFAWNPMGQSKSKVAVELLIPGAPGAAAPHHDHTISWPNLTAHYSGVTFHRNQSCDNARPNGRDDKIGLGRPANRYFSLRVYCLSHSRTTDSMPCMCKL